MYTIWLIIHFFQYLACRLVRWHFWQCILLEATAAYSHRGQHLTAVRPTLGPSCCLSLLSQPLILVSFFSPRHPNGDGPWTQPSVVHCSSPRPKQAEHEELLCLPHTSTPPLLEFSTLVLTSLLACPSPLTLSPHSSSHFSIILFSGHYPVTFYLLPSILSPKFLQLFSPASEEYPTFPGCPHLPCVGGSSRGSAYCFYTLIYSSISHRKSPLPYSCTATTHSVTVCHGWCSPPCT